VIATLPYLTAKPPPEPPNEVIVDVEPAPPPEAPPSPDLPKSPEAATESQPAAPPPLPAEQAPPLKPAAPVLTAPAEPPPPPPQEVQPPPLAEQAPPVLTAPAEPRRLRRESSRRGRRSSRPRGPRRSPSMPSRERAKPRRSRPRRKNLPPATRRDRPLPRTPRAPRPSRPMCQRWLRRSAIACSTPGGAGSGREGRRRGRLHYRPVGRALVFRHHPFVRRRGSRLRRADASGIGAFPTAAQQLDPRRDELQLCRPLAIPRCASGRWRSAPAAGAACHCGCGVCRLAWSSDSRVKPGTQSSLAVSADGRRQATKPVTRRRPFARGKVYSGELTMEQSEGDPLSAGEKVGFTRQETADRRAHRPRRR